MRRFFAVLLTTVASVLLVFCILFTALQYVINDNTFIANTFMKIGNASAMGLANVDEVNATVRLVDYMEGDAPDIDIDVVIDGVRQPMFTLEQEHTHMADVKLLYQWFVSARDMAVILMLVLFVLGAAIGFGYSGVALAQGYASGGFIWALFAGFLGTWAAMDFSSFWTFFHQMLFWNELWLFDSTESRMINLLPESFFEAVVGRTALFAGIAAGALLILAILVLVRNAAKKRRAEEAREAAAGQGGEGKRSGKKKKKKPAADAQAQPAAKKSGDGKKKKKAALPEAEQSGAEHEAAPAKKKKKPRPAENADEGEA